MSAAKAAGLTDPRASAAIKPIKVRRMRTPPVLWMIGVGHENEHSASKTKDFYFDLADGVAHKPQFRGLTPANRRFRLERPDPACRPCAIIGCLTRADAANPPGGGDDDSGIVRRIEFARRACSLREPSHASTVGNP